MNFPKKTALLSVSSLLLVALAMVLKIDPPETIADSPTPYTVSLTTEDPALISSGTYGSGTKTVKYVTFEYYLAKDNASYHTELNTSGYIGNASTSQITSITQIEASFIGNVKLEVGYDYGTVIHTTSPFFSSTPVVFTDNPYFFRITVLSGVLTLNSLTVTYSCLPTPASPVYTFDTDHYVVSGYTKRPTSVVIPSTYNGYPVTQIASGAFMNASILQSISIPSSVTVIGDGAFANCVSLSSITLPDVSFIGSGLFYNCSSLMSITIPSTVTMIGESAFYGCTGLTSITIPSGVSSLGQSTFETCTNLATINGGSGLTSIGRDAFTGTPWLTTLRSGDADKVIVYRNIIIDALTATGDIDVHLETITKVSDGAFAGCTDITSVVLPEGVTYIGEYAFQYCNSMTSFTMPSTVTTIGKSAFYGCSKVTSMTLPSGITRIEDETFYQCFAINNLVIPSGVTHIGENAFHSCASLANLTIPSSVTSLGSYAFANTAWLTAQQGINPMVILNNLFLIDGSTITTASVSVPSGVTHIMKSAFEYNASITSVTLPDGLVKIEDNAFAGCSNLASINLPESITSIGIYGFAMCEMLTSLTFPSGITRMEDYVLFDCIRLTSFTIPAGVTYIGVSAFHYCSGLTSLVLPSGVTEIGLNAFNNCTHLASITIPVGVTELGNFTFDTCSALTTIYYEGTTMAQWNAIVLDTYTFNNAASHTVYLYSSENYTGYWRYVTGVPTLW